MTAPTACVWGEAQDGSLVRLDLPSPHTGEVGLARVWPRLGLRRVDAAPNAVPALVCEFGVDEDRVESDLALFAAEHLTSAVAIHAGLVDIDGRRVLLPGPSRAGKSTLCAAGLDAGWVVLSDEFALIDPSTGFAVGWSRDMRIRGSGPGGRVSRHPVTPGAPGPVNFVVEMSFVPDERDDLRPTDLSIHRMTPGQSVVALLANTVCARTDPARAFQAALKVAHQASSWTGTRGDIRTAIPSLEGVLRRSEADLPARRCSGSG